MPEAIAIPAAIAAPANGTKNNAPKPANATINPAIDAKPINAFFTTPWGGWNLMPATSSESPDTTEATTAIAPANNINEVDIRIDTAPSIAIGPSTDDDALAKTAIAIINAVNVPTPRRAILGLTGSRCMFKLSMFTPFVNRCETTTNEIANATNAPDITIEPKANFVKLPTSLPIILATPAKPVSNNKNVPTAAIAPIGSIFNTVLSAPPFIYFANPPKLMPFAKMFDAITKPTLNVTNAADINNEPAAKFTKSPLSLPTFLASLIIFFSNMLNSIRAAIAPPMSNAGNLIEPISIDFSDIKALAM